jgi:hypothetical protein
MADLQEMHGRSTRNVWQICMADLQKIYGRSTRNVWQICLCIADLTRNDGRSTRNVWLINKKYGRTAYVWQVLLRQCMTVLLVNVCHVARCTGNVWRIS